MTEKTEKREVNRREFVKSSGQAVLGTAAVVGIAAPPSALAQGVDRAALVAAVGDTLIPTDADDPGYTTLEPHQITAEVLKELQITDADLALFNRSAAAAFDGRDFLQLKEEERGKYFEAVNEGKGAAGADGAKLQRVFRALRQRIFQVYYSNFPEHALPRDKDGVPILPAGDQHQITNPNTRSLPTGWDLARFMGPLTWEEEERRRNKVKAIDWKE